MQIFWVVLQMWESPTKWKTLTSCDYEHPPPPRAPGSSGLILLTPLTPLSLTWPLKMLCQNTSGSSRLLHTRATFSPCMPVCMLNCSVLWLFATPRTVAHQSPLPMEFSRQKYWSGLPVLPPGDLPSPGIKPESLVSPALLGIFFYQWAIWVRHGLAIKFSLLQLQGFSSFSLTVGCACELLLTVRSSDLVILFIGNLPTEGSRDVCSDL